MSNVTGTSQIALNFAQTPSSGFLNGIPLPLQETLKALFQASGVAADKVDGIHAHTYTFVASTPQTIDLTALTDILGTTITCARVRLLAVKVKWTTDNKPLILGAAGASEWDGFLSASGTVSVFPSSSANDGFFILSAPQTTGIPVSAGSKLLKMDPGTAAGDVDLIVATAST